MSRGSYFHSSRYGSIYTANFACGPASGISLYSSILRSCTSGNRLQALLHHETDTLSCARCGA